MLPSASPWNAVSLALSGTQAQPLTTPVQYAPAGSQTPVGLVPAQVRHAYGIDAITFQNGAIQGDGTGQTIAIVDAFDDPNIATDLATYDSQFGLPAPPGFTKVAQDGSTNYPSAGHGWTLETSLDVEFAHALAPRASILLVEANSANNSDINAAIGYASKQSGVVVVSMSFGMAEFQGETATDSLFTTHGVTFVSATGDSGAPGSYQAFSPNVLAVGGTTLKLDSSGNYLSENGWASSGGGLSQYEAQPAYQHGIVTQSTTQRAIPDVALLAGTGVAVCDSYDYGATTPWKSVLGTSVSAPGWAALIAIADQGRQLAGRTALDGPSQTLPILYGLPPSDFHDITAGNNGFPAGPGYDLVTGLGTPVANLLIPDLAAGTVTSYWTGAGSDALWSDLSNWQGGLVPKAGDAIVFGPGAAQRVTTNDLTGTTFSSIVFTGANYVINGNALSIARAIDATYATGANTINANIKLAGITELNGSSSGATLALNGNIQDNGYNLIVSGGGTVTLDGVLSGGGALTQSGTDTLVLAEANSYTGGTVISNGTVVVGTNTTLGTGTLTVTGGTIQASAVVSLANSLKVSGNIAVSGSFACTFTGPVTLVGNATLTVAATSPTTLSGVVSQSGGNKALTKAGAGTLTLSGSNTYAGGTTLTAGTLSITNASSLGSGAVTLKAGTLTDAGGQVTFANNLTLAGNIKLTGSGPLTLAGNVLLTGNCALTLSGGAAIKVTGVIGQQGGARSLTVSGVGSLTLSAANTYTGGTTFSGVTLVVAKPGALGSGTLTAKGGKLQAGTNPLTLTNAIALAGNVTITGSNNLTLTGPVTLTGKRTLTVSGSGPLTLAGAISSGSNAYGLTKAGTGTLILTGSNTYTGSTVVTGGVVRIDGTQTASAVTVNNKALLEGTGNTGLVTLASGGALRPGNGGATGILVTAGVHWQAGSAFDVTLNGTSPGTGYDQLTANGSVSLGGATLNVTLGFTPAIGTTFTLIKNDGTDPVAGTFNGLLERSLLTLNNMAFRISYEGGDGNDVTLTRVS